MTTLTDTTNELSRRMLAPVRHDVYVRRAKSEGGLRYNGERDGWLLEPTLRCERVQHVAGTQAGGGVAQFTHVPLTSAEQAFEEALNRFTCDDQVKVVAFPYDDELTETPETPEHGAVIFEGVMHRQSVSAAGDAATNRESVSFVAFASPSLDNAHTDHQVRGRWYGDRPVTENGGADGRFVIDAEDVAVIESPRVPAIFNFQGRPNRDRILSIVTKASPQLKAFIFTHDDAADARYWTVREAIASLAAMWLYGPNPTELSRWVSLDPDLATQLALSPESLQADGTTDRPETFDGIDRVLPETNVHGLGVLDAIARVCRAGGFDMFLSPVADEDFTAADVDRRYKLSIQKRNTGRKVALKLAKRGTSFADEDGETVHGRNDAPKFELTRDAAEIVNEVLAVQPVVIDCVLELKPLWSPDDVNFASVNGGHQDDKPTDDMLATDPYFSRYVTGGAEFDTFRGVFRAWGLDCVGGFDGYTTPEHYQHDPDGESFVDLLDLNGETSPEDGSSVTMRGTRSALGIDPATIRWTKRIRAAMPLNNPGDQALGRPYIVEISEDDGDTWSRLEGVKVQSIAGQFGILLSGVTNMAAVNTATFGTDETPAPADSWAQKILDGDLRVRLHCSIEADHAMRYDAKRAPTSGTRYTRGRWIALQQPVVWIQPQCGSNTTDQWVQFGGFTSAAQTGGRTMDQVEHAALAKQAMLQDAELAANCATWRMDLTRYRLGDRVTGIEGRNYSFALNAGNARLYPNIVGLTYELSPATAQGVTITLSDPRLAADQ